MAKKPKYVPAGSQRTYQGGVSWGHQTSFYDSWDDYGYSSKDMMYDFEEYDADGNLKSAENYYGQTPSSYGTYTQSASSRWSSRFSSYDGGYYSTLKGEDLEKAKYTKELKTIARSVNAVRSVSGKLKREQDLTVKWARRGLLNNITGRSEIYLSPDPLNDEHTLKKDWTEDQRRDVVIGEALTLVGMKRLTTPIVAKKILEAMDDDKKWLEYEIDYPNYHRVHKVPTKKLLREAIASILWKAVEQDAARSEVLKEYRGSRPYFAAAQVYYSSDSIKKDLIDKVSELDGVELDDQKLQGASILAAEMLAWNINHSLNQAEVIEPPQDGAFLTHCEEAMNSLVEAAQNPKTKQRFELALQAADALIELEPNLQDPPQQGDSDDDDDGDGEGRPCFSQDNPDLRKQIKESLEKKLNGEQNTAFGKADNDTGAVGSQDVEDVDDDNVDGLTDLSRYTRYIEGTLAQLRAKPNSMCINMHLYYPSPEEMLVEYRRLNASALARIKRRLDPVSQRNYLPEHGLRRGRLTGSSLWKATTELPDNDRVFHRKTVQGIDRDLTIGILLDYSGSMHGPDIQAAKRIALLIKDALATFPNVQVELFGHQSVGEANNILHFEDDLAMVGLETGYGTNEGTAYARCAKELISMTHSSSRKILFAIGDGCTGQDDLIAAVKLASEAGLETVDIVLDSYGEEGWIFPQVKAIFGESNATCVNPQAEDLEGQMISVVEPWLVRLMSRLQRQAMIA